MHGRLRKNTNFLHSEKSTFCGYQMLAVFLTIRLIARYFFQQTISFFEQLIKISLRLNKIDLATSVLLCSHIVDEFYCTRLVIIKFDSFDFVSVNFSNCEIRKISLFFKMPDNIHQFIKQSKLYLIFLCSKILK